MTLWFLLFALQVSLVAKGRSLMHQRIGIVGVVLAVLLSVLALLITIYSAKQVGDYRPPTPFLGLVLISFIPFPILVGSAIHYRGQPAVHKRLMLLATLSILGAALVRSVRYHQTPSVPPCLRCRKCLYSRISSGCRISGALYGVG
jgi:uncharacterized membrane protein YozB (DUF420 family)